MSDHDDTSPVGDDVAQLAVTARLLGRLLVRELDEATLRELGQPPVRAALAEAGIDVPAASELDELAHQWLTCFLHPADLSPPVHSLFRDGNYNSDPAVAIRRIAQTAGLELAAGARNAPPDHVGCILLLWAEVAEARPELARILEAEHMAWAERALQQAAARAPAGAPFYPSVAHATAALLRDLRGDR